MFLNDGLNFNEAVSKNLACLCLQRVSTNCVTSKYHTGHMVLVIFKLTELFRNSIISLIKP